MTYNAENELFINLAYCVPCHAVAERKEPPNCKEDSEEDSEFLTTSYCLQFYNCKSALCAIIVDLGINDEDLGTALSQGEFPLL